RASALAFPPPAMACKRRKQPSHVLGRHRLAVIEALAAFAADRAEIGGIGLSLHTLGDHLLAELIRKRDDRAENERGRAVGPSVAHQRAVDLDGVTREAVQIAQRAIARAEIVEREARAEALEPGENLDGALWVLHDEGFGDLELERALWHRLARQH